MVDKKDATTAGLTPEQRAEKIIINLFPGTANSAYQQHDIEYLTTQISEAEKSAAAKAEERGYKKGIKGYDLTVYGEYVERDGKRIPPEEMYKSSQDFYDEGFRAGQELMREKAAQVALTIETSGLIAGRVRALPLSDNANTKDTENSEEPKS